MSDPTDPSDADAFEDEDDVDTAELDIEAPPEDAVEQHLELLQQHDEPLTIRGLDEADLADMAEQRRVVDLDDDDYRE